MLDEILTHPVTGQPIVPVGFRKDGRPVWPILGAAPEGDGDDSDGDDGTDGQDEGGSDADGDDSGPDDGDKPLGEKGEKALRAEKDKRKAAQKQLREWTTLGLTPAQVRELVAKTSGGGDGDDQPNADEIRRQAQAEARAEVMRDRVLDKIEAKARTFADPADAAALLLREHDVDDFLDDGKIDAEAIAEALESLLEQKPYLAAQSGKRFQGTGDGGPRKAAPKRASSLAEAVTRRYDAAK